VSKVKRKKKKEDRYWQYCRGGTYIKCNIGISGLWKVKTSQYNHIEDKYIKKDLSERWNDFGEFKIQRDLYSSFLIMNVYAGPAGFYLIRGGVGDTLAATVLPANATNKAVNWSSNFPGIASVSATGVVTGVTVGAANITATTVDGNFTARCAVDVITAATYPVN